MRRGPTVDQWGWIREAYLLLVMEIFIFLRNGRVLRFLFVFLEYVALGRGGRGRGGGKTCWEM